ncbi:MAG: nucleoside kinase [Candidatus Eisenbacteria bacterium]|nr:nucleoside kinase [Candidatus Eisenbacteria bacterium]
MSVSLALGTAERHPIDVALNGQTVTTVAGVTVQQLLRDYPHPGKLPALGAIVNGRLRSLDHALVSNCRVDTVDYRQKDGVSAYRRTVTLILCEAARDIDPSFNPVVGQSLGGGYVFSLRQNGTALAPVPPAILKAIKKRMKEITAEDRPVRVRKVSIEEALEYFRSIDARDKVKLLETTRRAEVQWATVGNYRDLVLGPVATSTGVIRGFDLVPYSSGMILRFPTADYSVRQAVVTETKLYEAYRETRAWNEAVGIANVGQLNEAVITGKISDIIKIAEGFHERKIVAIADEIKAKADRVRLVLVAGPSSSGKTTFTKRLEVQLRVLGFRPVALSMDNYYVNREDTPKNPDGTYDFECLEALDIAHFNDQVHRLIRGEEVQTPIYSFPLGRRVEKTVPYRLTAGDVLITEGIHCLNPKLTVGIEREQTHRIYVSALTQLSIDDHNRIFTADVRLLRRIVRDRLFRNYSAEQTLRQWPSVRTGENKYIFPFQEEADSMFNSALVYEPAVIRTYAERFLLEVPLGSPEMAEAYRMLRFLHLLVPLFAEEVPQNSLLREFIGGSAFRY